MLALAQGGARATPTCIQRRHLRAEQSDSSQPLTFTGNGTIDAPQGNATFNGNVAGNGTSEDGRRPPDPLRRVNAFCGALNVTADARLGATGPPRVANVNGV